MALETGALRRGHRQLALENLALRQRLGVHRRTLVRSNLRPTDRLFSGWPGSGVSRPIEPPEIGRTVGIPEIGGLHHRYVRRAA